MNQRVEKPGAEVENEVEIEGVIGQIEIRSGSWRG